MLIGSRGETGTAEMIITDQLTRYYCLATRYKYSLKCCTFFTFVILHRANTLYNVTIDDQDPSISYFPQGSWYETDRGTLDAGGQHMVTSDSYAYATFMFKGPKDSHSCRHYGRGPWEAPYVWCPQKPQNLPSNLGPDSRLGGRWPQGTGFRTTIAGYLLSSVHSFIRYAYFALHVAGSVFVFSPLEFPSPLLLSSTCSEHLNF